MYSKVIIPIIFLISIIPQLSAQHMSGISNSNYAGTNGIIANPSYAADSRHGFYLNLISVNGYASNTYYVWNGPTSFPKFFINGGEMEEDYIKETNNNKPSIFNVGVDVRGPSFLLKLNPRSGLGIHTRARGTLQANNVSPNIMRLAKTGIAEEDLTNRPFEDNTFAMNSNIISEIGLTYARTVWERNQHFLKAGFTVKRLFGTFSSHLISDAMDFNVGRDEDFNYFMDVHAINARYGYNTMQSFDDNIDPLNAESLGKGLGFDIGFTYEHRPDVNQYSYTMDGVEKLDNRKNKYDYKIGLSILDIGSIKYKTPFSRSYAIQRTNKKITESDFDALEGDFVDVVNGIFDVTTKESSNSYKSGLPTVLKIDFDFRLTKNIYTSLSVLQNLKAKEAIGMRQNSMFALTPRIETGGFELAFPVSLTNNFQTFGLGTSVKLGLLFIGSDNLASVMGLGKAYGADVYLGIAFPFSKGKKKDSDNDGVSNREDECRNVAGIWEFKGCPDGDGDGVEDRLDKCPDIAGIETFEGCPDSDVDGIQDTEDECPQLAGLAALKGCPDSDEDGVADHLDKCEDVPGHVDLQGCPDSDGDGIVDSEDKCPEHAGPTENSGCPDSDGDGIPNHLDECPEVAGQEQHKGCSDLDGDDIPDHLDQCPELYGTVEQNGCPF